MASEGGIRELGFMEDKHLLSIHEKYEPKGTDCKYEQCSSVGTGCLKQVGYCCEISYSSEISHQNFINFRKTLNIRLSNVI